MFFLFLKQFNDDDIHALMNFLELVLLNYKKEPSKFVEIINTNITTSLSESFVDKFYENFECQNENEDLFSDNCTKPCCSYDKNDQNSAILPFGEITIKSAFSYNCRVNNLPNAMPPTIPANLIINTNTNPINNNITTTTDQNNEFSFPDFDDEPNESELASDLNKDARSTLFQKRQDKFNHSKPSSRFSPHNNYLIEHYNRNKYPSSDEIKQMAQVTQLKEKQIYTWFQERRVKLKHTRPTRFSTRSINFLKERYNQNIYPSSEDIKQMSQFTKLTEKQIYTWFQERRVKLKHTKKLTTRTSSK